MASGKIDLGIAGIGPAEPLARGGSAQVYLAEQTDFGRMVAIKVLDGFVADDDAFRRFDRECRIIGRVSDHPNIVVVHGRGQTTEGQPYLVMEHRSGGSLAERLKTRGRLTEREVIDIGTKVSGALTVAHRAGILHRDIKPANILLSAYDEPALADFGIARMEGLHRTTKGTFGASVAYAPREVLLDEEPTERSDIYALGVTLYQLVTGQQPYSGGEVSSVWEVINRILTSEPPDPHELGVSDGLALVLGTAMAHDPARRPASAEELADALTALAAGRGLPVRATGQAATQGVSPTLEGFDPTTSFDSSPRPDGESRLDAETLEQPATEHTLAVSPPGADPGAASGEPAVSPLGTPPNELGQPAASAPALGRRRGLAGALVAAGLVATIVIIVGLGVVVRNADGDADSDAGRSSDVADGREQPVADGRSTPEPTSSDQPGDDTTTRRFTPILNFARAAIGPLRAGDRYVLDVDLELDAEPSDRADVETPLDDAQYRILLNGEPATESQSTVPIFFPPEGRYRLEVEVVVGDRSEVTDPLEIYVAPRSPERGLRANLASIRSLPAQWPEALQQFDLLVANGHDDLKLSLSDRIEPDGQLPYWNYYIDGFGEDAAGAQAYCDDFGLGPDECFVARVE